MRERTLALSKCLWQGYLPQGRLSRHRSHTLDDEGMSRLSCVSRLVVRAEQYGRLMRLHRPIGSLLLLWPTLWALWLAADGRPTPYIVLVFALGVLVMRSAGCVINDYADRDLDPHVARTKARPLVAGQVSPREALYLFTALCLVAFALVLTLNGLTIWLSLGGVFLAITYPFLKRYTHLPQFYLGVAFGWGIPMGFAAEVNALPGIAWGLLAANILWAVAYDTMYAMADRDDDLRVGARSTAILFGRLDRMMIGLSQVGMLGLLVGIGVGLNLEEMYFWGLLGASGFGIYQHYLIRHRQPEGCLQAFHNNNWLGAAVFIGIFFAY